MTNGKVLDGIIGEFFSILEIAWFFFGGILRDALNALNEERASFSWGGGRIINSGDKCLYWLIFNVIPEYERVLIG